MRVGFEGEGDPIPLDALPGASEMGDLPTQTLLLENGVPFLTADYIGLGYTHYEVICVGACGGRGSETHTAAGSWAAKTEGGGGGGGGLHVVSGLLVALPAEVVVVVGEPGADGALGAQAYGGDGGYSSFNGDTCKASGGKGGFPSPQSTTGIPWPNVDPSASTFFRPGGQGGQGGVGNTIEAGGGAAGAFSTYTPPPAAPHGQYVEQEENPNNWSHPNGSDGSWDGTIGQGGGGGLGGTFMEYSQGGGLIWTV